MLPTDKNDHLINTKLRTIYWSFKIGKTVCTVKQYIIETFTFLFVNLLHFELLSHNFEAVANPRTRECVHRYKEQELELYLTGLALVFFC